MVVAQALSWEAGDNRNGLFTVSIYGRTPQNKSVCVTTFFRPGFYLKLPFLNPTDDEKYIIKEKLSGARYVEFFKKKDLLGFRNGLLEDFVGVFCDSLAMKNKLARKTYRLFEYDANLIDYDDVIIREGELRKYETNIDPILRFMHETGIESTGWFSVYENIQAMDVYDKRVDCEIFCDDWTKINPVQRDELANFVVASFDIETYSSTGKFPDPTIPGDEIFQIAISLCKLGSTDIYEKICLCSPRTSDTPGGTIQSFDSEKDLLLGFRDYINKSDIDILTGWNIFGFDLYYIWERVTGEDSAKKNQTKKRGQKKPRNPLYGEEFMNDFLNIGKDKTKSAELFEKKLSSSALGDNMLKIMKIPGIFIFDLFQEVKRDQKLDSYSLNFVSKTFLQSEKVDMPIRTMFKIFESKDPDELAKVAEYCIQDTLLPHGIMDKLCTLINLIEMAKATWVPINFLSERGQQIKVFSQITRKARARGYMVPTFDWEQSKQPSYEGATVLEAQTGAYYTPITALDFEGLYPSIMIAHNLCYSTLITDPAYLNCPNIEFDTFIINGEPKHFVQNTPSLLPEILQELKDFRKRAKRDMAATTDPRMKQVYNCKQLAYKISMNSVYGFTGASPAMIPCFTIAAAVTREGRHMIEQTKELVEREFEGANVRYGDTDSVMIEFAMNGRTGKEAVEYSWELGERAAVKCNELFANRRPKNIELEKVYYPYILYSKKRYAANMWTKDKKGNMNMDYMDVKGLQLVRRDNVPFVREVSRDILNIILDSNNAEPAKELAKTRARELLDGQVSMEKLILSQKLADSYKNNNLAHVRVRDKMHERTPGSEPQSGDRVQYVLVKPEKKTTSQADRAEDPTYAREHNLPLDYEYYFTNKLLKPVCDLLEPVVENPQVEIFGDFLRPKRTRRKAPIIETEPEYKHSTDNASELLPLD